jgi:hypothetical protein
MNLIQFVFLPCYLATFTEELTKGRDFSKVIPGWLLSLMALVAGFSILWMVGSLLWDEIVEKKNVALAIFVGLVILGILVIVF